MVPATFAVTYTAQAAADKLAASNFIVDQSASPAAYRLADNLLRQEAIGTAANVLGLLDTPLADYVCQNKFSDVGASTGWVCRAAELAAEAGLTNAANATFRPKDNLTRFEALVFALRAAGLVPSGSHSQEELIELGADSGLITSVAGFNANASATRGEFFQYVVRGLDSAESPELCDILGICPDNNNGGGTSTGGAVSVSLSSNSPAGYTVPKAASGLHVASYKVSAVADTVLSSLMLKRMGLSEDLDVLDFTVLVNGARVSDPKDENSDDEVTITLKQGGVMIKGGQSVTVDVLLNVDAGATTGAEFAVSLVSVIAGGSVSGLPVMGNVFKVGSSTASTVEIDADGSVSDPKLGQVGADLFRFKVENPTSNDTISLHSITFEQTGGANTGTDLANFVLKQGSTVLATTPMSNGDYVTFNLATPLTINQGNNVSLKVAADILSGAGEDIEFEIDNKLDVRASSTRFGNAIGVTLTASTFAAVDIEAGAISLVKMDATNTKIREDKDDVVLGGLDIVAAQTGLEVKEIGFTITSNGDAISTLLEDVQIRNVATGARYDLSAGADGVARAFTDNSIDLTLAKGSNKFEIIADTVTTIAAFDADTLTLSMDASTQLLIEETNDDEEVTDVTPSSLTWKKVDGSESGASVSLVSLADLTRVRGATDVIAMHLDIKADESSALTLDEIKAYIQKDSNNGDAAIGAATNQMVSQVSLYEGTAVSGTPLDSVSGSQLAAGVATFDGFEVVIAANTKKTFTIAVSFVDGATTSLAVNSPYNVVVSGANISIQDDENDDVTVGGTYTSARDITVTDTGVLTLTADANNDDNEEAKTILAGTTATVFSVDIQATNETVDVERVIFTYTARAGDLLAAGATAQLWLGDTMIATAPNADIATTGTVEVSTVTVTAGPTATGVATITLNGVATNVSLTNGDSTSAVASKIANAVNATTTHTATYSGAVVWIVANVIGNQADTVFAAGGATTSAATSVASTGTGGTITFGGSNAGDLTNLIVPLEAKELRLAIVSNAIGFEKNGAVLKDVNITQVVTDDATGVSSGRDVADDTEATSVSSSQFAIAPAIVTPAIVTALSSSSSQAKIKLSASFGSNANSASPGGTPTVSVDSLTFSMPGAVGIVATDFVLYEEGNSGTTVTGAASGSNVTFDLTAFANSDFTTNKTYVIVPTIAAGETATLNLLENGVQYDVDGVTDATNFTINLLNELDFGSRSISN
jgi:S-layer homology domain